MFVFKLNFTNQIILRYKHIILCSLQLVTFSLIYFNLVISTKMPNFILISSMATLVTYAKKGKYLCYKVTVQEPSQPKV